MKRRRLPEDEEHPDRWVVSYADFVTLLFAFFTTMYAVSHVDSGKIELFTGSMRTALKVGGAAAAAPVIDGISPVAPDVVGIERDFRQVVESGRFGRYVDVRRDRRGVVLSVSDQFLFASGQARIRQDALPGLASLAAALKRVPYGLAIEGHTDNMPLPGGEGPFRDNWELSTARAVNVLRYFVEARGLDPARCSASGYAEFRPLAPNETPEGRAKNRRVDIIVRAGRSAEKGKGE
ncbi:MAG: flagellar motor protein MotB [Nitrospiraceae bacterium]|nr:flagellar motor protein MotB [Nitrospiraceae bacterium]